MRDYMPPEQTTDRAVDTVVATSAVMTWAVGAEHAALIFSLFMGGCYYAVKIWLALRNRDKVSEI